MRLRWLSAAADDLEDIHIYLLAEQPSRAHSTINAIYDGIQALRRMPWRGRPVPEADTRELVLPRLPYIVTYRITEDTVEILYIRHGVRDRA